MTLAAAVVRGGAALRCHTATMTTRTVAAACAAVRTTARTLYGGTSRGDLLYVNACSKRTARRKNGMLCGVMDSGQSTLPMCGQLHIRKHLLHAMRRSPMEQNDMLTCDVATWTHLLPSLRRCAESLVPDALWQRLCSADVAATTTTARVAEATTCVYDDASPTPPPSSLSSSSLSPSTTTTLTPREVQTLADAQQLFAYELHQRITLLEDSIAHATLHCLVEWPAVFRRVWVALPLTPHTPPRAPRQGDEHDAMSRTHAAPSRSSWCGGGAGVTATPFALLMPSARRGGVDGARHLSLQQQQLLPPPQPTASTVVVMTTAAATVVHDARDVRPTSNQVFDLPARVRRLTRRVAACVHAELQHMHDDDAALSPRERARTAALRRAWHENMAWHESIAWHATAATRA